MCLVNFLRIILLLIIFSFSSPTACGSEEPHLVTRAAIDIGSGGTKFTVGEIDPQTNRIVRIRDEVVMSIKLRQDLAMNSSEELSDHIQKELIDTIKQLQNRINSFAPAQVSAVGTSVFRTAKNGPELLKKIEEETGITVRLLSQDEEGEIGFASAMAIGHEHKEEIIVWDSGSGSFQLTAYVDGKLEMYGAEFGMTPALERLFAIRKQPIVLGTRIPPVSLDEAMLLSDVIRSELPCPSEWISSSKQVVAIGRNSIFSKTATALGNLTFIKEEVLKGIAEACNKNDEALSSLIVAMTFLYTVMDHCGIQELTYYRTNGSTEGLLITPRFWKMSADNTQLVKTAAKAPASSFFSSRFNTILR